MILGGLAKTTLLDYPGRIACTVFTSGCNLRCPFCHNASLVIPRPERHGAYLYEGDFFSFLEKRKGILDGVVVSGGEPLMQADIEDFLYKIKSMGYSIKLDTNGSFPDKLTSVINSELVDYVAMDIKNSPEKYLLTSGRDVLDEVRRSVDLILSSSIEYEFRTTAVAQLHTEDDFKAIGEWIKGAKRYFIQCFKDSGDILGGENKYSPPSSRDLETFINAVKAPIPSASLRGI
ncbi:MAG: anaerobic ribonucleoside-triphosphate reductase activating protein [Clostridia bacterium]|nr:anaerobic ribonucleoside-triphosphate reductase activating protein [Clostridia bacterium]